MRHRRRGRQLSRDTEHRIALRRNMAQSLFEHGSIRTTLPKALEVQPFVEKLITQARRGTLHARRLVIAQLRDRRLTDAEQEFVVDDKGFERTVVQKLFADVAPRYEGRAGGYTRIIKTADYRLGDGGDIVVLQLVGDESEAAPSGTVRRSAGLRRQRNQRREQFAKRVLSGRGDAASQADPAEETPQSPDADA